MSGKFLNGKNLPLQYSDDISWISPFLIRKHKENEDFS